MSKKDLFSVLDGGEVKEKEIFILEEENFSPNALQLWLLKKKDKFCPNLYPDENMSPTSTKDNQTLKGVQGQKLKRKSFSVHMKFAQEQDYKDRVERPLAGTLDKMQDISCLQMYTLHSLAQMIGSKLPTHSLENTRSQYLHFTETSQMNFYGIPSQRLNGTVKALLRGIL
ncbi:hypothetical protein JHK82_052381 [Glycine max]|nr:hypothetical protein JHK86_052214 [Glycine max]KAG4926585.1 hypothetical protein JHK85_053071 [Glycine max]KAG5082218.1 hypothetical protein JHK84_052256 [Glycine max]KAG5084984.1 hypothetical protein JHK82_052381 [Glycine max]